MFLCMYMYVSISIYVGIYINILILRIHTIYINLDVYKNNVNIDRYK